MYDIVKVIPNRQGTLDHVLVAGAYVAWGDLIFAIHALQSLTIAGSETLPVFNIELCHHRKNSNHFRTYITHTATTNLDELRVLLGDKK